VRLLNALCFALIVWQSSVWFGSLARSRFAVLFGVAAVLLSRPLLQVSLRAWSEPLFCLLTLASLNQLGSLLRRPASRPLALAAVFAGSAMLTRNIGFTVIASGGLVLLFGARLPLVQKWAAAAAFVLIAATMYAPWAIRNLLHSMTPMGLARAVDPAAPSVSQGLAAAGDYVTRWFIPPSIPLSYRLVMGLLCFAILIVLRVRPGRAPDDEKDLERRRGAVLASGCVFIAVYATSLLALASRLRFDPIADRLLSPLYVPIVGLLVVGADDAHDWAVSSLRAKRIVIAFFATSLVYPLAYAAYLTNDALTFGAGGYSTTAWQDSALIGYLRAHPPDEKLVSNAADVIAHITSSRAIFGPSGKAAGTSQGSDYERIKGWADASRLGRQSYLAWFKDPLMDPQPDEYRPEDLASCFDLSVVHESSDGTLFLLTRRSEP